MSPVEMFILDQPEKLRPVLKKLRALILSASPFIVEKLVYNIPFFYGKKRIFYLNPQETWVDLGFCDGYLLAEYPILEIKDRTQVKTARFKTINCIIDDELLPVIHEAIIVDQIRNQKSK